MMKEFTISAKTMVEDLQLIVSYIHDHFDHNVTPLRFKATDKVSLAALSQIQVWAQQIGQQTGEDHRTVFNRMKKDHGLPIALADPERGKVLDYIIKQTGFYALNERRQLMLVDAMEITRHFSTKQHNAFRDSVEAFYNHHGFNLQYTIKGK